MCKVVDIYYDLFDNPDILHALAHYTAYSEHGFFYDFGYSIIPKGTKLYRVRKYIEGVDFSKLSEWRPAPSRPQNRCNACGEVALYLGTDEHLCLTETHVAKGDTYVLGTYEVMSDLKLSGYTNLASSWSKYKIAFGILANAFLIAPVRSTNNMALFQILDSQFDDVDFVNIGFKDILCPDNFKLPFRIGHIVQKDEYYFVTNSMCSILKAQYPHGVSYSSCYFPMSTVGIECSAHNVALYEGGIKHLKFIGSEMKVNDSDMTGEALAKLLFKIES